jgi:hypothetical protein
MPSTRQCPDRRRRGYLRPDGRATSTGGQIAGYGVAPLLIAHWQVLRKGQRKTGLGKLIDRDFDRFGIRCPRENSPPIGYIDTETASRFVKQGA